MDHLSEANVHSVGMENVDGHMLHAPTTIFHQLVLTMSKIAKLDHGLPGNVEHRAANGRNNLVLALSLKLMEQVVMCVQTYWKLGTTAKEPPLIALHFQLRRLFLHLRALHRPFQLRLFPSRLQVFNLF
jgi:hypothetical protein